MGTDIHAVGKIKKITMSKTPPHVVYLARPLSFYGADLPADTMLAVDRVWEQTLQVCDTRGYTGIIAWADVTTQQPVKRGKK